MADFPLNQLPENTYIRFDDIARFQNNNTSDLILKNVRDDGSLVLANRSVFGRVINWFNTRLFGTIDPNAKYVAELFAKQVSSLSEHGGAGIIDDLNLKTAPSLRNREVRLVLSKLAGTDGNAKFRFDNLRPLERRRAEMLDCLSKFIPGERNPEDLAAAQDSGALLEGAIAEADLGRALSSNELKSYEAQLKIQFQDYFATHSRSPSTDQGFEIAVQILRVMALDNPQSMPNVQLETALNEENVPVESSDRDADTTARGQDLEVQTSQLSEKAVEQTVTRNRQPLRAPIVSGEPSAVTQSTVNKKDAVKEAVEGSAPSILTTKKGPVEDVKAAKDHSISIERARKDLDAVNDFLRREGEYSLAKDWLVLAREYQGELEQLLPALLESKDSDAIDLVKDLVGAKTRLDFKLNLSGRFADTNRLIQLISFRKPTTFSGENQNGAPGFNELMAFHFKDARRSDALINDVKEYSQYLRGYRRTAEQFSPLKPEWLENIRKKEIQSLVNSEEVKYLNAQDVLKRNLSNQYDLLQTTQRETRLAELEAQVQDAQAGDDIEQVKSIGYRLAEMMTEADQNAEALMINPDQKMIEEGFSRKAQALLEVMQEKFPRLS